MSFLRKSTNHFYGVIQILLCNVSKIAILDFIHKIFDVEDTDSIEIVKRNYNTKPYYLGISHSNKNEDYLIKIHTINLVKQFQVQEYLDLLVLCNTYLNFFTKKEYLEDYGYNFNIVSSKYALLNKQINEENNSVVNENILNKKTISDLVKNNTDAKKEKLIKYSFSNEKFYEYDFTLNKLSKNLAKKLD